MASVKNIIKLFVFILTATALTQCADEPVVETKEKIQFTIGTQATSTGGRTRSLSEIPAGATLHIKMESNQTGGEVVFDDIALLHVGDAVMSAPIELSRSYYLITEFYIVSESDEIIFATPRRGSRLETLAKNPLDTWIVVSHGTVQNFSMDVVSTTLGEPEDFGFVSFNPSVVHPFQMGVMIPTVTGVRFTDTKATLFLGSTKVQQFDLSAGVNKLSLRQDPLLTYKLVIEKSGYAPYREEFKYNELDGALLITLTPAFTLRARPPKQEGVEYNFELASSEDGTVDVDWGFGFSETRQLGDLSNFYQPLEFSTYFVSITGDLEKVEEFSTFYGDSDYDDINTAALVNLKTFRTGFVTAPVQIDLTTNTKLETVACQYLLKTERILLPLTTVNTLSVDISYSMDLTQDAIEKIVSDLYASTVAGDHHGGSFKYFNGYDEQNDPIPLINLSLEGINKLRELRDTYGYTIVPDVP